MSVLVPAPSLHHMFVMAKFTGSLFSPWVCCHWQRGGELCSLWSSHLCLHAGASDGTGSCACLSSCHHCAACTRSWRVMLWSLTQSVSRKLKNLLWLVVSPLSDNSLPFTKSSGQTRSFPIPPKFHFPCRICDALCTHLWHTTYFLLIYFN